MELSKLDGYAEQDNKLFTQLAFNGAMKLVPDGPPDLARGVFGHTEFVWNLPDGNEFVLTAHESNAFSKREDYQDSILSLFRDVVEGKL